MIFGIHTRLVSWLERALITLALLYLAVHTLPRAWKVLNTDFPNYYMSARLVHDHYDLAQMYDWTWLEREKDHRAVDIRVIGLLPITPFSTLAMAPLAGLTPLAAKHVWIVSSLTAIIPIIWMLKSVSHLKYQQIGVVFALCFSLHRNLEFGQFYIILLLLLVASFWSYLRGWMVASGVLIAIAAACKVFPILFVLFFLRRRAWKALAAATVTLAIETALSIAVFGWNVHSIYIHAILPWTLHGEAMPPYFPSASISGILHRLFLAEPQWNPHPWHSSVICFALLMPLLEMIVLAPAVLLIRRRDCSRERILLELSALMTASLAISTIPALYNFVLLAFPLCVVEAILLRSRRYNLALLSLTLYCCICLPLPNPEQLRGALSLLLIARLPLILILLGGIYWLLRNTADSGLIQRAPEEYVWLAGMLAAVILSFLSTLRREEAIRMEYAYRLPLRNQGFLNAEPQRSGRGIRYVNFTYSGYHLDTTSVDEAVGGNFGEGTDVLSFVDHVQPNHSEMLLVERAASPHSQIVDVHDNARMIVDDGRDPMISADGKDLTFIRDDHGRGRLMELPGLLENPAREFPLTNRNLNVYDASYISRYEYAFSASLNGRKPDIYLTDATHSDRPLNLGESRYPALSPDGRWLVYSHFDGSDWNLWLYDLTAGSSRPVAHVPCNVIQAAWEEDSKTVLYATDCGRSLWFTAVARRRIIP